MILGAFTMATVTSASLKVAKVILIGSLMTQVSKQLVKETKK